jgi:hypothetical protein
MTEDPNSGKAPFGSYRTFAEMLEDYIRAKSLHQHREVARAVKTKTGITILEKNISNWRRGENLPTTQYLKPLADTLGITGDPKAEADWNRLYAEADAARRRRGISPPSEEVPEEQGGVSEPEVGGERPPVSEQSPRRRAVPLVAAGLTVAAAVLIGAWAWGGGQNVNKVVLPPLPPLPPGEAPAPPTYLAEIPSHDLRVQASGFVLPQSATQRLTREELVGLTGWELYIARNEIYARYGRKFHRPYSICVQNHFDTWRRGGMNPRGWYTPVSGEPQPSQLEQENAALIAKYECEERGGQFLCHGKPWPCGTKRPEE